jgi:hypothetical protein
VRSRLRGTEQEPRQIIEPLRSRARLRIDIARGNFSGKSEAEICQKREFVGTSSLDMLAEQESRGLSLF